MRRQGFLNCRNLWLSHFVTVQNATSQIHVRSAKGYTLQCRRHVQIDVVTTNKVSFVNWFMDFITDIHTHKHIYQWNNAKMGKNAIFHINVKSNLGTLPSTQNTFSVLLDSICAVTAMITKCDKSQNATTRIPELSQFVTVAFCDGSKCNFSDYVRSARGYTPQGRKHVHIDVGHYQ